jgi:hypothetical protein
MGKGTKIWWDNTTKSNWVSESFWNWHFVVSLVYSGGESWYELRRGIVYKGTAKLIDKFSTSEEARAEALRLLLEGTFDGVIERRKKEK